jgi:2-keto-3-deoxy-L-rhamnonate aldolase RhmA
MNRTGLRRFRERLNQDGLLVGLACATMHPAIFEVAGSMGLDFALVDAEHAALDRSLLETLVRAGDVEDIPTFVKIKRIDEVEIRDALDSGAAGIVAPHVRTADDVRRLVDACYFRPRGHRGLCGTARAAGFNSRDISALVRWTNEELVLCPIIEDIEAVHNLDEILAVDPSIEIYEVGPVDMALSLGLDLNQSIENPSPELREVLEIVHAKLRAAKKHILYPSRFPNVKGPRSDVLRHVESKGIKLLYGIDTHLIVHGIKSLTDLREVARGQRNR